MEYFVSTVHVIIAVILVLLVLVQDSKGGGLGAISGGSQSVLGAAGAENILAKVTRIVALIFATTCIILTFLSKQSSVMDSVAAPVVQAESIEQKAPSKEQKPASTSSQEKVPPKQKQ